ncbi:hypothetical protein QOZ96_002066 [Brevundimonas nasdae]|nr:N-6 DNA methylase [Brevundimonas nasdae]MDQ0452116.1 hypothetical protein [Brevundimonas nasdae]
MVISEYLERVIAQFKSGHATEHSYRPALNDLFQSIDPALTIINEPKQSEGGMPDFMFQRDGVPIGWAEAKDIDKDVIKLKGYSVEQRKRYEAAYPNLIYTNGVDFEFIRDGQQVHFVSIADFQMGLQPVPEKFEELERQLKLFAEQKPISIKSASKLAEMMAAKAAIIKDEIGLALKEDPEFRSGLGGQFKSFKANLLPHLEPDEFADIYAETITYGMFAARFHDDDLTTFSRQEAMDDLPASNPFLKGLFEYVAGPALPKRLTYIVDDLVEVMRASDPHSLFRDFGKFTARNDPFIHFYEDFLAAYNPKKRKSRGVWYTPEPVVDFIVRAVDDVLKSEFGLADGLADTSKVTVDWDTGQNHPKTGKPITEKRQVHRVQILDPATGTGTFLAKAVQLISDRVKAHAPGKWSGYVEQDLLPRLHGFELLMASYAMCHMKLDMQLAESGYKPSAKPPRLSVWLTNALEPAEREVRDLFFQPLAEEARGASEVKRQSPIMCVIGNPPYSGISQNNGEWITRLIEDYKYIGKKHFGERKHWLHDDYVKFIRMAEHTIAQNPSGGVLGFITNHGYLDNPTFRGMRWRLLQTFDKIWVVDLHGNTNKPEPVPPGLVDKNVFDIRQGVALVIAIRKGKTLGTLGEVWHGEIWGSRESKSAKLFDLNRFDGAPTKLKPEAPYFMMAPFSVASRDAYDQGFSVNELMVHNVTGIATARDHLVIGFSGEELRLRIEKFIDPTLSDRQIRNIFFPSRKDEKYLAGDTRGWKIEQVRPEIRMSDWKSDIRPVYYRPFDKRWIIYRKDMVDWGREAIMKNYLSSPNIGLLISKAHNDSNFAHSLVTDTISEVIIVSGTTASNAVNVPLYIYPDTCSDQSDAFAAKHRTLNLDPKLYAAICKAAGIDPANQAGPEDDFRAATGDARPSEIKVFDYIYGVLHSPDYRATYAEFLKIDFPRIPYPASPEVFRQVSDKGEQLRRLHLMEAPAIGETHYPYHGDGDDVVAAGYPKFEGDRVHINADQYFDAVPDIAWNFFIGGYQPAQKWLKDRRGRALSWDDIGHYQKVIKIMMETDTVMGEISLPITG